MLEGGFDGWCRRYYRDPERVADYDDDYWLFEEMEEAGSGSLFADEAPPPAPAHRDYERPADQPETPWSAAGSAVDAAGESGAVPSSKRVRVGEK